ncbi:MAG: hypothetical protein MJK10_17780 [Pseudomonadales bacterium]|nr:hypothetical protein [Pseudomonadales bacterium]
MTSEILEKKEYLLHWMYDFIEDDDEPAYLASDVLECDKVLTKFINTLSESATKSDYAWVVCQVEAVVKALNVLNAKHANQLIETDQREDICALIALVIQNAGHGVEQDITEQWREW